MYIEFIYNINCFNERVNFMSEEILDNNAQTLPEAPEPAEAPSLVPSFKSVCVRIGIMMIITFAARIIVTLISFFLAPSVQELSPTMQYLVDAGLSTLFLYIVPITAAVLLLKHPLKNAGRSVYGKPKYFGRALAMFPAGYGIAITVNLLTQLLGRLFADTDLGDSFTGIQDSFTAPDTGSAVIMFIRLAVLAPIFEELWCRGLVIESLRPYGNGFAIFVSALLFGIIHANFAQFFYATALGIFLGYIYISTQSLVTTTVMHAMFNSISGVLMLLIADESVGDYLLSGGESGTTPAVVLYLVWMGVIILLLAVGIIMAIYKFTKIKKYRVPKVQTEISTGRRWGIFFSRASVIVMLLLAVDSFALNKIPEFFLRLFTGKWD